MRRGRASLEFERPPVVEAYASVAGKKEGEGPLGPCFDQIAPLSARPAWGSLSSAFTEPAPPSGKR